MIDTILYYCLFFGVHYTLAHQTNQALHVKYPYFFPKRQVFLHFLFNQNIFIGVYKTTLKSSVDWTSKRFNRGTRGQVKSMPAFSQIEV